MDIAWSFEIASNRRRSVHRLPRRRNPCLSYDTVLVGSHNSFILLLLMISWQDRCGQMTKTRYILHAFAKEERDAGSARRLPDQGVLSMGGLRPTLGHDRHRCPAPTADSRLYGLAAAQEAFTISRRTLICGVPSCPSPRSGRRG